MDRLMTAGDAAKTLGLAPTSVRLFMQTGKLRVAATTVGGIKLVTEHDVMRLARQRAERRSGVAQLAER